jgi:nucleoside-diphosphate-sugar epimerase
MIAARLVKRGILVHEPLDESRVNRTVLVVGGAGYIGAVVVRRLLQKGYRVRVLDRLVYGDAALREILGHRRLEFLQGDCRNIHDVVNAMAGVGSVIHLAAIVGDPACEQDHKTALETNYAATRMMIEVAKGEHVRRFIFASSCSVYGASDEVMDEESIARPISLYAETKVDSEKALLAASSDGFHPTILRFSTIFGLAPRPRFDLVVNLLAARAIQERTITIFNGEQWRPFLHVADAAEAVIQSLQAAPEVVGGQIFNVGDDQMNYSLAGVGTLIQSIFPGTAVENVENTDRRSYRVSFEKIKRILRFRCTRSIEDGLAEIKAAFERRQITDYRDPYYSNVQFLKKHGSPLHRDRKDEHVMAAFAGKAGD